MSERHKPGTTPSPIAAGDNKLDVWNTPLTVSDPALSEGLGQLLASVHGRRILVVEDEILIAGELANDIEELGGLIVGPAYSVAEAMTLSASEEIDAAILDINLGGKEVFPVSDQLVQRGIPFIFHTGTVKGPVALKLYDGVPVISKPSLTVDLLQALVSVFEN